MNNIINDIFIDNNRTKNADVLFKKVKVNNPNVTKKDITAFLASRTASQISNQQKKTKDAQGHIVAFIENEVWQIDLYFMLRYKKANKGFEYIFAVVDVFTRRAYIRKQKTKDGATCAESLKSIIKEAGVPRLIMSDNDPSFGSKEFTAILDEFDIALDMNVVGDHNALGIIDNFAKRIKYILTDLFNDNHDDDWISYIDTILKVYNETEHKGLQYLSPNEAQEEENYEQVYHHNLVKSKENKTVSDLSIGDKVRVRTDKVFTKGTDPNFSDMVYEVAGIKATTITLNDGVRRKRDNLLKIPNDTPLGSTRKNIIDQRKDEGKQARQLTGVLNAQNDAQRAHTANAILNNQRLPRIKKSTKDNNHIYH